MINFIDKKNIFFIVSALVILAGLVCFIIFGGLNLGLDFTGGTAITIDIHAEFNDEDIVKIVKDTTGLEASVQKLGDDKTEAYILTEEIGTEDRDAIVEAVKEKYSLAQEDVLDVTNVSASASALLLTNALQAIMWAVLAMLIYITFRFNFRSGVAAILGLVHNVLVMLAVYAIFQLPINSTFVAAILTIVGYSINDTIVVFDKIRENVKRDSRTPFGKLANISLNQTLLRTLNTSLTTLFTITALYILGVTSIKEFALPIIIGVIVGTYSSVCIATPLWVVFRDFTFKKNGRKSKKA